MARKLTRRHLLSTTTRTAAALSVGSMWARSAMAATRKIGANDRVVIGVIGTGGRGAEDARHTCRGENVVCAAAADVAKFRLEQNIPTIQKVMESEKGISGIRIDAYGDYRKILDRKDIDAVIIGTPDHWHMRQFIDAVEAGKHIYCEKPMSKSIEQGYRMLDAAQKRPELVIQIGTQRRSDPHYPKVKELIDKGTIGEITFARCYDCRNWVINGDPFEPPPGFTGEGIDWDTFQEPVEKKVPFDAYRYFAWRWYWDYANGLVTDVGVHVLDIVHWLTGKTVPRSVVCNGGVYALKKWETPDVVNAVWDYGTHSVAFTSNFANGFIGSGLTLYGTKGTVEVIDHHIKVYEGDPGKPIAEFPSTLTRRQMIHHLNWIECIRTGAKPNAPVELGVSSLLPLHLANMAYREGRKVTWDAEARKAI